MLIWLGLQVRALVRVVRISSLGLGWLDEVLARLRLAGMNEQCKLYFFKN